MAEISSAQDPNELFDVVLADGTPTGETKSRSAVHRDGDWHRALHVWIAGLDDIGTPFLLFQRRGLDKDTWPGRLDATVGGHLRAGEGVAEALREVDEEIGVAVTLDDPRPLGIRRAVSESEPGVVDHELQDVFLLRDDRPLSDYRPNPAEVASLVRFPLPGLLDMLSGMTASVPGLCLVPGAAPEPVVATAADFVPTIDRYFYRVAIAADRALRGERHVAV